MDSLPVELVVTIIAIDSFELFTALLRVCTIGNRLCEEYPQQIAREKFITTNHIGTKTYLNGKLHSFNGKYANINALCVKYWYKYGKLHRRDQPAIEYANGDNDWYWNDERHRENDQPAVENANGGKEWYWYGKPHRENDLVPALVEYTNGKKWYLHGKFYRK